MIVGKAKRKYLSRGNITWTLKFMGNTMNDIHKRNIALSKIKWQVRREYCWNA